MPMTVIESGGVVCACGAAIGQYVAAEDGRTWLDVGGVTVRGLTGQCTVCGARIDWAASDVTLERLLGRLQKNKLALE